MPQYFLFHVALRHVEPTIWRRFLIASDARFVDLHEAIQDACGWTNSHLFAFRDPKGKVLAELPDPDGAHPGPDAMERRIASYFGKGKATRCLYDYDFGDGWEHSLVLEEIASLPEKFGRRLIAGQRNFPLDDCGGIGGYEECVEIALGRAKDPERLEWLEGWHPERFDLKKAQKAFLQKKLRLRGVYDEEF